MEQDFTTSNTSIEDFKYFNRRLQILQLRTSNTSIEDFKYFNWRLLILQLRKSKKSIKDFKSEEKFKPNLWLFQEYFNNYIKLNSLLMNHQSKSNLVHQTSLRLIEFLHQFPSYLIPTDLLSLALLSSRLLPTIFTTLVVFENLECGCSWWNKWKKIAKFSSNWLVQSSWTDLALNPVITDPYPGT